jgi:hypothetical protein
MLKVTTAASVCGGEGEAERLDVRRATEDLSRVFIE